MPVGDDSILSTPNLLKTAMNNARQLAAKELELARAESLGALKMEREAIKSMSVAAVLMLLGTSMAITALMLGLFGWRVTAGAGLIVLTIGSATGYVGWKKQIKSNPVPQTQDMLEEDLQWIKETLTKTS